MTEITGGLRARLIRDSIYHVLFDGLADLGWFDSGRQHRAISFPGTVVDQHTEIPMNTLALVDEDQSEVEGEMGSNLGDFRWTYYVDFYAEDDVIGKHLIYDVRDILAGRMVGVGRTDSSVAVLDYTLATPTQVFVVQLEDIIVDRAHDFPKPWQRNWYACRFTVLDSYGI